MYAKVNVRKIWIASALLALSLAVFGTPQTASCSPIGNDEEPESGFLVNYFVNASLATGGGRDFYKLFNTANPGGLDVCAQIYVFDPQEDMTSCCSCRISAGGAGGATAAALTFNPAHNLPIQPVGSVKVVATVPTSQCGQTQEASMNSTVVPGGLCGVISHIDTVSPFVLTEEPFLETDEPSSDLPQLAALCGGTRGNGSGICGCAGD